MKYILMMAALFLTLVNHAVAAERMALKNIDTNEFTSDTQVMMQNSGDKHVALVWWIPNEFWQAAIAKNTHASEADKKTVHDSMAGVSVLAVVQADITSLGTFQFYTKEEIEKKMLIFFDDASGKGQKVTPLQEINPNLEKILSKLKPVLGAMGNLGDNLNFYVLNDKSESTGRLLDPYQKGQINVQLQKKDATVMKASIELPLNSLFVTRKCPNGKPAHISWQYCPWSGERLED